MCLRNLCPSYCARHLLVRRVDKFYTRPHVMPRQYSLTSQATQCTCYGFSKMQLKMKRLPTRLAQHKAHQRTCRAAIGCCLNAHSRRTRIWRIARYCRAPSSCGHNPMAPLHSQPHKASHYLANGTLLILAFVLFFSCRHVLRIPQHGVLSHSVAVCSG